ncbi:MAG TPA: DUF4097 family beta strand repeat-containing protein [Gaiellaceae bacterium]|jgi:hypothetical protein
MQKQFEVAGAIEVDVRLASGEVEIDATLDGRVEVELVGHDEESHALVEASTVELREHGAQKLVVDVPQRKSGFGLGMFFGREGVSCRVRCPSGSSLTARTKSADVTARGLLGGANVATASGDVELERIDGSATVKSASGDVSAREVTGSVSVQTASGDVSVEIVGGPVTMTTASGDVEIGEAYDSVSVNTVSGDQHHRAVMQATVGAHSVSGDVEIGVRKGSRAWLDCNTVSGDTSSELELSSDVPDGDGPLVEIRAKTVSGDIKITRAPAPAGTMEVHA